MSSFNYPDFTNSRSNDDEFNSITDQFNSYFKWMTAASIILSVIGTVAVVAIVYAIIDCLKKTGSAIPAYTQISSHDWFTRQSSADAEKAVEVTNLPVFPVLTDSQVKGATMERFLDEMAREKPIRFSYEQLSGFTQEFSTVLGAGGFGVVYKGEFPSEICVAVKVLNNSMDKRVEEQFMAEVSTVGRTYHFNLVRLYGFCFDPSMRALVYEYMENGSLDGFLFDESKKIQWEKLYGIAVGTAKGITYLHEECHQRIIHYDIKPGNVLLDAAFSPSGVARIFS